MDRHSAPRTPRPAGKAVPTPRDGAGAGGGGGARSSLKRPSGGTKASGGRTPRGNSSGSSGGGSGAPAPGVKGSGSSGGSARAGTSLDASAVLSAASSRKSSPSESAPGRGKTRAPPRAVNQRYEETTAEVAGAAVPAARNNRARSRTMDAADSTEPASEPGGRSGRKSGTGGDSVSFQPTPGEEDDGWAAAAAFSDAGEGGVAVRLSTKAAQLGNVSGSAAAAAVSGGARAADGMGNNPLRFYQKMSSGVLQESFVTPNDTRPPATLLQRLTARASQTQSTWAVKPVKPAKPAKKGSGATTFWDAAFFSGLPSGALKVLSRLPSGVGGGPSPRGPTGGHGVVGSGAGGLYRGVPADAWAHGGRVFGSSFNAGSAGLSDNARSGGGTSRRVSAAAKSKPRSASFTDHDDLIGRIDLAYFNGYAAFKRARAAVVKQELYLSGGHGGGEGEGGTERSPVGGGDDEVGVPHDAHHDDTTLATATTDEYETDFEDDDEKEEDDDGLSSLPSRGEADVVVLNELGRRWVVMARDEKNRWHDSAAAEAARATSAIRAALRARRVRARRRRRAAAKLCLAS